MPAPQMPVDDAILINSNENPYGPSQRARDAMWESQHVAGRYPDDVETRVAEAIARMHNVGTEQVVLGCGSTEILRLADMAFLSAGKNVVACDPTFEAVLRYARATQAEGIQVPQTADYRHDLPAMAAACNEKTGLVYICNPNNPTGTIVSRDELAAFIPRVPSTAMIMVDEAYHHFVEDASYATAQSFMRRHPNVFIVRTFSKIYGLAGLRLGYGVASVEMADQAPVDIAPRQPSRNGPLCIAYIGRVTQMQKRTFDLVSIASHVERLGIACAIHIVGDGEDLAALSHRVGAAGLSSVKFRFHGARSEAWVLEFLRGADILVSCSDSEGTSISMMEAMGRGVVPVVTDVSGVRDWIEDGVSGRIVRVGDTRGSAEAIAQLAHDRGMLARLARGAWESARRGGGTTRMADVYAQLWRQVLDRPAYRAPASASCVTLTDERRWPAPMRCASATEMRRCRSALARAGLSTGPRASDDVYLDGGRSGPRATPRTLRVRVPSLLAPGKPALIEAIRREIERGARRVAVFGCGRHTTRCAGLLGEFEQLVGYIDDNQEVAEFLGKPAVRTRDALTSLRPDTIVLSSDAHERALWDASAPLRIAGVRVVTLYGEYDGPARSASA